MKTRRIDISLRSMLDGGRNLLLRALGTSQQKSYTGDGWDPLRRIGVGRDDVRQPYTQSAWVYAGARANANYLSGVPLLFREGERGNQEDPGEAVGDNHPLMQAFAGAGVAKTSRRISGGALTAAISTGLDIDGEVFLWLLPPAGVAEFKPGMIPSGCALIPPRMIQDVCSSTSGELLGWRTSSGKRNWSIDEIVPFVCPDPTSPKTWRGLSPLRAASLGIAVSHGIQRVAKARLANGGEISGLLTSDADINEKQRDFALQSWRDRYSGADNAGSVAILGKGMKYMPIAETSKDGQWLLQAEFSREEVLAVLGVPKLAVGLIDDVNRATGRETRAHWWASTLRPRLTYIQDMIWCYVCEPFSLREMRGRQVWGEYDTSAVDEANRDFTETVKQAEGLRNAGFPRDHVNKRLGLGMEELGDPRGTEDLTNLGQVPESVAYASDGLGSYGAAGDKGTDKEEPAKKPKKGLTDVQRSAARMRRMDAFVRQYLTPHEKAFQKVSRSMFAALKREQIRSLEAWQDARRSEPLISIDDLDQILVGQERWSAQVRTHLGPGLLRALTGALRQVEGELGGFDVVNPADPVFSALHQRRMGLLLRSSNRWRNILRKSLIDHISENGPSNVASMATRIRKDMQAISNNRSVVIARTEVGTVNNGVRHEVFVAEKVATHEWLTSRDERVRDGTDSPANHQVLDGAVVKVGDPFANGLLYPMEQGAPASEVINCRCVAFAVEES